MGWVKSGQVPKDVSHVDNPNFYDRVLLPCRCSVNAQAVDQNVAEDESVDDDADEEEEDDEDEGANAPELTAKRFRMEYRCTKPYCQQPPYQGRQKVNLWKHIQTHKDDPLYDSYVTAYKDKYEKKSTSKKEKCPLCGKMIVAHPSNMKDHQARGGCKKPDCRVLVQQLQIDPERHHQELNTTDGPLIIRRPRVVSLFDGISSGLVALKAMNVLPEVYFSSEIDPFCLGIQRFNFGDQISPLGDICDLDHSKLRSLGRIDLLFGGSPCNDLSGANYGRQGLTGTNSYSVLYSFSCFFSVFESFL
ncbi:DNA (cytosine-5)-methyltransferase 3B [Frankliniella fusca]|uniref:DNA (cytosine-5-)-methyltransferase n=1 Tax=Frankliniella fusca TaxID=407009 RepID=A0AAE1LHV0_9NEOP|nr:DNA (cytosine-5)-methyltransferase 3B [Frankliniella fusca]